MHYCIVILSLVVISESTFNNSCLLRDLNKRNIPSKSFDCPAFVLKSTDEIWNGDSSEAAITDSLQKYMAEDWESVTVYGQYLKGFEKVKDLVLETRRAFPDLKLYITDCFCQGNDIDGYKTTMPVIHVATHLGYHPVLGAPTGKKVTYAGIPNTFIKKFPDGWKYTAEWNIFDAWSLYDQIGKFPPHAKKSPLVVDKCQQIFDWNTGRLNRKLIPKQVDQEEDLVPYILV